MQLVRIRQVARLDLVDRYVYLAENAGKTVAERFFVNAEKSFADLARQPMMGSPVELGYPELAGLRKWSIAGFENVLVFYRPYDGGVPIIRVLHAAQDWWRLFDMR
jgi:toxin ParE1/3/4